MYVCGGGWGGGGGGGKTADGGVRGWREEDIILEIIWAEEHLP